MIEIISIHIPKIKQNEKASRGVYYHYLNIFRKDRKLLEM